MENKIIVFACPMSYNADWLSKIIKDKNIGILFDARTAIDSKIEAWTRDNTEKFCVDLNIDYIYRGHTIEDLEHHVDAAINAAITYETNIIVISSVDIYEHSARKHVIQTFMKQYAPYISIQHLTPPKRHIVRNIQTI